MAVQPLPEDQRTLESAAAPLMRRRPVPGDPASPPESPTKKVADDGTAPQDVLALVEQAALVIVGMAVATVATSSEIVWRTLTHDRERRTVPDEPPLAAILTGAAIGAAMEAAAVGAWALRNGWAVARWGTWLFPSAVPGALVRRTAERWNERWEATSERSRGAAAAFARELVPDVIDATLDQVDLTALVEDRVDLDTVVASVDLDAVVAAIDLDRIVERLDVDAVARRIDLDAVVQRIDVERVVRRIDVTAIAREVIDELDLLTLIRDSSESVTSEAVDDLRLGAVDADRAVARAIDRILGRRSPRTLEPVPHDGRTP